MTKSQHSKTLQCPMCRAMLHAAFLLGGCSSNMVVATQSGLLLYDFCYLLLVFAAAAGTYSDAERRLAADASGDCTPCPGNRTTTAEGASSAAECTSAWADHQQQGDNGLVSAI